MNRFAEPDVESSLLVSGAVLCDSDGAITWVDPALAQWLSVDPQRWLGCSLHDVFRPAPDEQQDSATPLDAAVTLWTAFVDGYPHRLQIRLSPLPVGFGQGTLCTVVALDEFVANRIVNARIRLRSTIESVVAGFAHEVRNPLASILTLTELTVRELRNSYLPVDGLMRIPALVARVERLIRQALEYSRPLRPIPENVGADYVVNSAVRLVATRFEDVKIAVCGEANCTVRTDRHQFEQVLTNLIQNACEAPARRVEISFSRPSRGLLAIAIADDGPGVEPALVESIFEPFFTSKAQGTGLGLPIARDLARLNGGDVRLANNPSGGATFEILVRCVGDGVTTE